MKQRLNKLMILGLVCAAAFLVKIDNIIAQSGPIFRVHTIDGKDTAGALAVIKPDWSMRVGGAKPVLIPAKNVISVFQRELRSPPHPLKSHLILTNGDRIPFELSSGFQFANEQFRLKTSLPLRTGKNAELKLSLLFVKAIWIKAPGKTIEPERFFRRLLNESRSHDLVLLKNGDRAAGTILNADSRNLCRIKTGNKVTVVPFKRVAAMYFNSNLAIPPPRKTGKAHVVLKNGARITLSSGKLDAEKKHLLGKSVYRFPAHFALDDMASLTLHHDHVVYLSDLKPSKFEHRPFFGRKWHYSTNSSLLGSSLRLKGLGTFDWGIGVHTGSRLNYELNGKYAWFEALAGLDPRAGQLGSARFRIFLDGTKTVYDSKEETVTANAPRRIRISVKGANSLGLRVDYVSKGNVNGHTNWVNARLLKW